MDRYKSSVLIWLLLSILVASPELSAQQTHATPSRPAAAGASGLGSIEDQFARERPRYQGALSGLAKKTVLLPDKRTITVGELSKTLFKDQQRVEQEFKKAPAGALWGTVKVEEVGYEYADAYVLTRRVSVVVADPAKLRPSSPTFAKLAPKVKGQMTLKDLKPEALPLFFNAKAKLLAAGQEGPAGHPLRAAAAQGDQALLDATLDGAGELSLSDSFMILKVSSTLNAKGQLLAPPLVNGIYDLSKRAPIAGQLARPVPEVATLPTTQVSNGMIAITGKHLNGFTYSQEWLWERRWEFFSGHVWLKAGLAYGFGLRIPIELQARMSPTQVVTTGAIDQPASFEVEVSGRTLDGDGEYFRRAGLGQPARHNGEEFLLFAEVGYGYSFEALWMNFGDRPYATEGFDLSRDFKPPQSGSWTPLMEYFVPAELTRTRLNLGVVQGQVEVGLRLDGKGWVDVAVRLLHKGQAQLSLLANGQGGLVHTLRLDEPSKRFKLQSALGLGAPGKSAFGFVIDQIKYNAELSVLPGLRYGVTLGYKWFSKSFSDTLWFDSLRLVLPALTLGTHEGTAAELRYEGGEKTYKKTALE